MSDFFEMAKITQDTYMSGSHQGQQYMLKKIKDLPRLLLQNSTFP